MYEHELMEFWIDSRDRKFKLPINPLSFVDEVELNYEEIELIDGNALDIGNEKLHTIKLDSLMVDRFGDSMSYIEGLRELFRSKQVVRLVVIRGGRPILDMEYNIVAMQHEFHRNKITYSITLMQYKKFACREIGEISLPPIEKVDDAPEEFVDKSADEVKQSPAKHENFSGETITVPYTMTVQEFLTLIGADTENAEYNLRRIQTTNLVFPLWGKVRKGTIIKIPKLK